MCVCVCVSPWLFSIQHLNFKSFDRFELLDNIELMLVTEQAPDNGNIFDDHNKRYCTDCTHDAQHELSVAEAIDTERLDSADEVQVQINGGYKAADEVECLTRWDRIKGRQVDVGC